MIFKIKQNKHICDYLDDDLSRLMMISKKNGKLYKIKKYIKIYNKFRDKVNTNHKTHIYFKHN